MSESVRRRRGCLNHEHLASRTRKLRDNGVHREEQDDALSAAWRDFLAAERERRGNPNWRP